MNAWRAYRGTLIPLWCLVFIAGVVTLVMRHRTETAMMASGKKIAPAVLLKISTGFVLIISVVSVINKIDPGSSGNIITRTWSFTGAVNLLGTSLASAIVSICCWWTQLVQTQTVKVSPKRFNIIAAVSLSTMWVACIVNFVIDSLIFFSPIIWSTVVVTFIVLISVWAVVVGFQFLWRLRQSRQFEKSSAATSRQDSKSFLCFGRLSRVEQMIVRTAGIILIVIMALIFFFPTFISVIQFRISLPLAGLIYDMILLVSSILLLLMLFVAPKKN